MEVLYVIAFIAMVLIPLIIINNKKQEKIKIAITEYQEKYRKFHPVAEDPYARFLKFGLKDYEWFKTIATAETIVEQFNTISQIPERLELPQNIYSQAKLSFRQAKDFNELPEHIINDFLSLEYGDETIHPHIIWDLMRSNFNFYSELSTNINESLLHSAFSNLPDADMENLKKYHSLSDPEETTPLSHFFSKVVLSMNRLNLLIFLSDSTEKSPEDSSKHNIRIFLDIYYLSKRISELANVSQKTVCTYIVQRIK